MLWPVIGLLTGIIHAAKTMPAAGDMLEAVMDLIDEENIGKVYENLLAFSPSTSSKYLDKSGQGYVFRQHLLFSCQVLLI